MCEHGGDRQTGIVIDKQHAELRWRQLIRRDRARQTERGGNRGLSRRKNTLSLFQRQGRGPAIHTKWEAGVWSKTRGTGVLKLTT